MDLDEDLDRKSIGMTSYLIMFRIKFFKYEHYLKDNNLDFDKFCLRLRSENGHFDKVPPLPPYRMLFDEITEATQFAQKLFDWFGGEYLVLPKSNGLFKVRRKC